MKYMHHDCRACWALRFSRPRRTALIAFALSGLWGCGTGDQTASEVPPIDAGNADPPVASSRAQASASAKTAPSTHGMPSASAALTSPNATATASDVPSAPDASAPLASASPSAADTSPIVPSATPSTAIETPPVERCPQGYQDWFRATFPYPDGGIIGSADYPQVPWFVSLGALSTQGGAAVASGPARMVTHYGTHFPLRPTRDQFNNPSSFGTRVRYRVSPASNATVEVRLNAGQNGNSPGHSLSVGQQRVGLDGLATTPLEQAAEYFVQIDFVPGGDGQFRAAVTAGDYIDAAGATLLADLRFPDSGSSSGNDDYLVVDFSGGGGTIDDILLSRCGKGPQEYSAILADTFERPDGEAPGAPISLNDADWQAANAGVALLGGALVTQDATVVLEQSAYYYLDNLRLRAAVTFGAEGSLVVHYNGGADALTDGFELTPGANDTTVHFAATDETQLVDVGLAPDQKYYLELDVQEAASVLSVRTEDYAGPIVFAVVGQDTNTGAEPALFEIGSSGNPDAPLSIDEVFVDAYAPGSAF